VDILDRMLVGIELEIAARRLDVRLQEFGAERLGILYIRFRCSRQDQLCRVIGLNGINRRQAAVFRLEVGQEFLAGLIVEVRSPLAGSLGTERGIADRKSTRLNSSHVKI